MKVPFSVADIGDEEIEEVTNTLRSGWLTMGPKTFEFEKMLAEYTGADHAIAVNSCTAALHLSLIAAGIKPGDEVITTPLTFAATGNVIVHAGAKPVFVDIDPSTYNIDVDKIEYQITRKTKAIIPVHFAGLPCDIDAIFKEVDIPIIEDAAHAIGATQNGRMIGNLDSLSTCFSFYATKNMTTGEGGAITTNDTKFSEKVRKLRLHGISKDAWKRYGGGSWKYDIEECGWKYNTTDINAALGVCQLRKLDIYTAHRQHIAEEYTRALSGIDGVTVPDFPNSVYHLYPLLVPAGQRDGFIEKMAAKEIGCSVHFIPLHLHSFYQNRFGYKRGDFPVCESVYDREVSIPLYPKMTYDQVRYVIDSVKGCLK